MGIGIGIVIRDDQAQVLASKPIPKQGFLQPKVAESWGAQIWLFCSTNIYHKEGDAIRKEEDGLSSCEHIIDYTQLQQTSLQQGMIFRVRQ